MLACLDGYLNIALEQTEEYVNGQLKQKYGDAFLRGNNGMWLHFVKQFSGEIRLKWSFILLLSLTVLYISTQKRK